MGLPPTSLCLIPVTQLNIGVISTQTRLKRQVHPSFQGAKEGNPSPFAIECVIHRGLAPFLQPEQAWLLLKTTIVNNKRV
jgi:hypothetical protein